MPFVRTATPKGRENQMTDLPSIDPVTVTVSAAMKYSGLGRTKLYELLTKGEIESTRVGTRRLIVFASLKARLTNKTGEIANG
jgi:excisionase family DNA binding protein